MRLLGPIFSVELLTSARRARYFLIRALCGVVLLFALWANYAQIGRWDRPMTIREVASLAESFFNLFSWIQVLAILLMGPAIVSGTIAQERERRTIEYLFATNLSNAEIVLGKLAARLLHIGYLVLVGLPILSLASLLGGIPADRLWMAFLITMSTMVAVAAMAMAVSVWAARAREAVSRSYVILFALLVVPPFMVTVQPESPALRAFLTSVNGQILAANPGFALMQTQWSMGMPFGAGSGFSTVIEMTRNQAIFAAICLGAAVWGVRRVHLKAAGRSAKKKIARWQIWRPSLGDHPMLWKELFAERTSPRLGWAGRIAVALILLGVLGPTLWMFFVALDSLGAGPENFQYYAIIMGGFISGGGVLMIAARAAGTVSAEKERDCWATLLSTPLTGREILSAKLLGNLYAARGLVLLLALIWGLAVLLSPGFVIVIPFLLGTLAVVAYFASALGLSFSLRCKNSVRAMSATLATSLFIGGGYWFCCMPFAFGIGSGGPDSEKLLQLFLAPCVPFLLAFPGIVYTEGSDALHGEGVLFFSYAIGVFGYMAAGFVLHEHCVAIFNRVAGRTDRSLLDEQGWLGSEVPIPVEVVEEPTDPVG